MTGSFRRRCPQELLAMRRSHLTELRCQMQARERTGLMFDVHSCRDRHSIVKRMCGASSTSAVLIADVVSE